MEEEFDFLKAFQQIALCRVTVDIEPLENITSSRCETGAETAATSCSPGKCKKENKRPIAEPSAAGMIKKKKFNISMFRSTKKNSNKKISKVWKKEFGQAVVRPRQTSQLEKMNKSNIFKKYWDPKKEINHPKPIKKYQQTLNARASFVKSATCNNGRPDVTTLLNCKNNQTHKKKDGTNEKFLAATRLNDALSKNVKVEKSLKTTENTDPKNKLIPIQGENATNNEFVAATRLNDALSKNIKVEKSLKTTENTDPKNKLIPIQGENATNNEFVAATRLNDALLKNIKVEKSLKTTENIDPKNKLIPIQGEDASNKEFVAATRLNDALSKNIKVEKSLKTTENIDPKNKLIPIQGEDASDKEFVAATRLNDALSKNIKVEKSLKTSENIDSKNKVIPIQGEDATNKEFVAATRLNDALSKNIKVEKSLKTSENIDPKNKIIPVQGIKPDPATMNSGVSGDDVPSNVDIASATCITTTNGLKWKRKTKTIDVPLIVPAANFYSRNQSNKKDIKPKPTLNVSSTSEGCKAAVVSIPTKHSFPLECQKETRSDLNLTDNIGLNTSQIIPTKSPEILNIEKFSNERKNYVAYIQSTDADLPYKTELNIPIKMNVTTQESFKEVGVVLNPINEPSRLQNDLITSSQNVENVKISDVSAKTQNTHSATSESHRETEDILPSVNCACLDLSISEYNFSSSENVENKNPNVTDNDPLHGNESLNSSGIHSTISESCEENGSVSNPTYNSSPCRLSKSQDTQIALHGNESINSSIMHSTISVSCDENGSVSNSTYNSSPCRLGKSQDTQTASSNINSYSNQNNVDMSNKYVLSKPSIRVKDINNLCKNPEMLLRELHDGIYCLGNILFKIYCSVDQEKQKYRTMFQSSLADIIAFNNCCIYDLDFKVFYESVIHMFLLSNNFSENTRKHHQLFGTKLLREMLSSSNKTDYINSLIHFIDIQIKSLCNDENDVIDLTGTVANVSGSTEIISPSQSKEDEVQPKGNMNSIGNTNLSSIGSIDNSNTLKVTSSSSQSLPPTKGSVIASDKLGDSVQGRSIEAINSSLQRNGNGIDAFVSNIKRFNSTNMNPTEPLQPERNVENDSLVVFNNLEQESQTSYNCLLNRLVQCMSDVMKSSITENQSNRSLDISAKKNIKSPTNTKNKAPCTKKMRNTEKNFIRKKNQSNRNNDTNAKIKNNFSTKQTQNTGMSSMTENQSNRYSNTNTKPNIDIPTNQMNSSVSTKQIQNFEENRVGLFHQQLQINHKQNYEDTHNIYPTSQQQLSTGQNQMQSNIALQSNLQSSQNMMLNIENNQNNMYQQPQINHKQNYEETHNVYPTSQQQLSTRQNQMQSNIALQSNLQSSQNMMLNIENNQNNMYQQPQINHKQNYEETHNAYPVSQQQMSTRQNQMQSNIALQNNLQSLQNMMPNIENNLNNMYQQPQINYKQNYEVTHNAYPTSQQQWSTGQNQMQSNIALQSNLQSTQNMMPNIENNQNNMYQQQQNFEHPYFSQRHVQNVSRGTSPSYGTHMQNTMNSPNYQRAYPTPRTIQSTINHPRIPDNREYGVAYLLQRTMQPTINQPHRIHDNIKYNVSNKNVLYHNSQYQSVNTPAVVNYPFNNIPQDHQYHSPNTQPQYSKESHRPMYDNTRHQVLPAPDTTSLLDSVQTSRLVIDKFSNLTPEDVTKVLEQPISFPEINSTLSPRESPSSISAGFNDGHYSVEPVYAPRQLLPNPSSAYYSDYNNTAKPISVPIVQSTTQSPTAEKKYHTY